MENTTVDNSAELIRLPLWKQALADMRNDGLDYEKSWPVEFFEQRFRTTRDTQQFTFEMLELRQELEREDGYYFRSSENGRLYSIPPAAAHEDIARMFESKMSRYARRSVSLRYATLDNEKADLTDRDRAKLEQGAERASVRLALMSRVKSVERELRKHCPQLLAGKGEE